MECIFRSPQFYASLFRIERPNVDTASKLTTDQKNDISETQLDDYPFDAIIVNDGEKKQVEKACLNIVRLFKNKLAVQNAQTSIIGLSSLIQSPKVIHANS